VALVPSRLDFARELVAILRDAHFSGQPYVDVRAGDLHRRAGWDREPRNRRMPTCCSVMRNRKRSGDEVLYAPPKGDGAKLTIRYRMPRTEQDVLARECD